MTEPQTPHAGPPPWVRQLVDFGALLAFGLAFLFFRMRGLPGDQALVHATWALVAGSAVAVVVGLLVEKRLALMPLLVGGFALVFGVMTLLTNDDVWVKVKVTVLNASLAIALLGGLKLGKQPLKALLGTVLPITDAGWRTLTFRYGLYFLAVAVVNEAVRSEALVGWIAPHIGLTGVDPADVWVSFRGVLWIASSVFGLSQVPLILKSMTPDADRDGPGDPSAPARPDTAP
jgi:intracellular septation protein